MTDAGAITPLLGQTGTASTANLTAIDRKRLKVAADQLEAVFSTYLLKELKFGGTVPGAKEDFSSQIYGDMFKQALAEKMAQSGSLGLAKQIYKESTKLAELELTHGSKNVTATAPDAPAKKISWPVHTGTSIVVKPLKMPESGPIKLPQTGFVPFKTQPL